MDACNFDEAIWNKYVDRGFCKGQGSPESQVCVEVALSIACGFEPTDQPVCALPASRRFAIVLNDKNWSSAKARAEGMKDLALAQLGTAHLSAIEFCRRLAEATTREIVPLAMRAAALRKGNKANKTDFLLAAQRCENEGTKESALHARKIAVDADAAASAAADSSAYAAYAADAAYAAAAAAATSAKRDHVLALSASIGARILMAMKTEDANR